MDEYIIKQSVLDYLNRYLDSIGECGADSLLFDRGQRRALINSIQDIVAIKPAEVQTVDRWISVDDALPIYDGLVLVVDKNNTIRLGMYTELGWTSQFGNPMITYITHWRPLPELPKAGDAK